MVCTYGKVWNSTVTLTHEYLLHTANSNKTHSVLTDFMTTGWVQVNTSLPAEDWAQYNPFMTFADWDMHCLLLFCICQNKTAFLKVPQWAITERQFAWYNICSSVNLESSSPSYFRQSIRLLQAIACYAAIRFIFLKSNFKKAFIKVRDSVQFHPSKLYFLFTANKCLPMKMIFNVSFQKVR